MVVNQVNKSFTYMTFSFKEPPGPLSVTELKTNTLPGPRVLQAVALAPPHPHLCRPLTHLPHSFLRCLEHTSVVLPPNSASDTLCQLLCILAYIYLSVRYQLKS